jgi:hypothetical protein
MPPSPSPVPLTKHEQKIVGARITWTFTATTFLICWLLLILNWYLMGWHHGVSTLHVGMGIGYPILAAAHGYYATKGWRLAREVAAGRRSVSE